MRIRKRIGPWHIMVVALLLVVAFLVLGYQSFKVSEKAAFDEFNQRQLVLARGAAVGIELYFESIAADLKALGRIPEVQQLEETRTRLEIRQTFDKLKPLGVSDVVVLDEAGNLQYSALAPQTNGVDSFWQSYSEETRTMASGDVYTVKFFDFEAGEEGETGILVAVPLFEIGSDGFLPGKFVGLTVGILKLSTIIERFVAPIRFSEEGHAFLIDDEFNVLWAPDSSLFGKRLDDESQGFPALQQITEDMSAGDSGSAAYTYYEFDEFSGAYNRDEEEENLIAYGPIYLENESWALGVWAPKEDVRQLIWSTYRRQLLVVGLSILVTIGGAVFTLAWLKESYGQIAEEQDKVLMAIEASRDPIWVSDARRQLVMANSALEDLVGQPREELLGHTCRNLLNMRSRDGALLCDTMCPLLYPEENVGRVEACLAPRVNTEVWSEVSYGRVTDSDGNLTGVLHIAHDLTERKEVERLKDEFISTVSHELRTPLNHIKGFATTLLQTDVEWDTVSEHDFLESISNETDRLTNLVEKILHLSRLESDGLPMEKEWWQVNDLVDGALQRRRGLIADREIRLRLASSLPVLFVDGRDIEVVLMNLIENASKYSDRGTPITLGVVKNNTQITFSVADRGIGIPPEDIDRVFDRFYRADGAQHRNPGTGLGLAICQRIVLTHSGHIWVKSTPGIGSCFYFSLPVNGHA